MHEISIMQATLDLALTTAQASAASQINALHLRIGAMTGVVPEALQFAFEALRDGTIAAEATLQIETVPAACWCAPCAREFAAPDGYQACPECGRASMELRHGLELELASIEVT
ncbi:MAG: hydrogenase maturation nickel metallochaperone HypA [Verrucomicrobiota bacterium]